MLKKNEHVVKVWNKFQMKTMEVYHDLCLKDDVLLVAEVFVKFRKNSLKNYGLCPSHMTKVELELIPDVHMYLFFERGMRGEVSYISNRYSKANINYLNSYDPRQKFKHIVYLDTNNLYGYAMSKFLPTSGFKCIDPK